MAMPPMMKVQYPPTTVDEVVIRRSGDYVWLAPLVMTRPT